MSGLFTVIIAQKQHIDAIRQDNKLFFEPFLESKEQEFCYWDPEGQSLKESVPGLMDAVGRHKTWRAIIINNGPLVPSKAQNPFDVVDRSGIDSVTAPNWQPGAEGSWDQWETAWKEYYDSLAVAQESMYRSALECPLQKLATWLCYQPEDYILNDVKETQDVHDWAMEMLGGDDQKTSGKLEVMERDQYKRTLRLKERLRREFVAGEYLNIAYPNEVYCISLRSAESNYFDPENYWRNRQDNEYSAFADRNMYFDKMRFMVFDMLSPTHRSFRTDYIRLLATILIFASNPVPGSAMQARRLYQIDTETNDKPLCTLVTSYDKKLAATWDVIESEMEKIRSEIPGELTDKAAAALFCTSTDVSVLLDESCDTEKVLAEKDYGLFFDRPEDEFHKWNRDYQASEKELNYILKQQLRSVRKSVVQMHLSSEVSDGNISRLTPLQVDDIRDYTDAAEDEMVASIPPDFTDMSRYHQRISQLSDDVKKVIGRRMTKKTTLALGGICLVLYLLCFMPFLFANNGTTKTVTTAIVMVAILGGLMALLMLITLFFLRMSVLNAVRDYNNSAREILAEVHASLKQFSKYLSACCNVRRGHAVQNYAKKNMDEYTKGLRIRRKHQEDIRKRRAYLAEEYRDFFGDRSCCDETMSRPFEYDFDQTMEYTYPAPFLAGDSRQIEFVCNGNLVTVPSSYVTRILVNMEGIYEN